MTRSTIVRLVLVATVLAAMTGLTHASVERYAILIGHNKGAADEVSLRYAENDASKLRDVLVDIGGFRPENVTLLTGQNSDSVRRTLIAINDRLRGQSGQAVLLVYYSGHADADALHLGGTELSIHDVEQLVRGSSADVRLLILDSCRSGSLTRVKGGRRAASFAIKLDEELASSGAVFLTSSSSNEDAQESEQLKGSFFTHYLISGLLGGADLNGDGRVVLSEAYRHAYNNTLRASSRTLAGTQHPTYRYNLKGKGDIVLTEPGRVGQRGWLTFPNGRSYLIMRGRKGGPVEAEVGASDKRRQLSLRPGSYFVRGRGRDHLLEGSVQVHLGQRHQVTDSELERIDYARLVRKGGGNILRRVHGPEAGMTLRSSLSNSEGVCLGASAGYSSEYPNADIALRVHGCRAGFKNASLTGTLDETGIDLRVGKAWDLPLITVAPYLETGVSVLIQRFETLGEAPTRTTAAVHLDAGFSTRIDLRAGVYALLDVAAQTYWYRQGEDGNIAPSVAGRGVLGLGWRWGR